MKRMSTISVLREEVKKSMQEWMESYVKRDTTFLKRYVRRLRQHLPRRTVLDKKGEIESVKSGAVAFTEIPSEMKVRI